MTETVRELKRITGASLECGWMCDEVADFIASLVRFYRPHLVIQTGHLWGKSAATILEALTATAHDEDPIEGDKAFAAFVNDHHPGYTEGYLHSIDPKPMGVPHHAEGIKYLGDTYGIRFTFFRCKSSEYFANHRPRAGDRLMGLVDGDHSDDGCAADIHSLADLGAQVIIVDDVMWLPSLAHVARSIAKRRGYDYQQHSIYNGLGVLVKA